jgi:hypothetical protein
MSQPSAVSVHERTNVHPIVELTDQFRAARTAREACADANEMLERGERSVRRIDCVNRISHSLSRDSLAHAGWGDPALPVAAGTAALVGRCVGAIETRRATAEVIASRNALNAARTAADDAKGRAGEVHELIALAEQRLATLRGSLDRLL